MTAPIIRRAALHDCDALFDLLRQVEHVHHIGRPDIFVDDGTKFTHEQLRLIITDEKTPVFVAQLDGRVVGHLFCIVTDIPAGGVMHPARTLHIEDVCVDEACRGQAIGKQLISFIKDYAATIGCARMDLDVWEFNESAIRFYEKQGFSVQKRRMELSL